MANIELRTLTAFQSRVILDVQNAARDLNLLRIIERTVESVDQSTGFISVANIAADQIIGAIHARGLPDGLTADLSEQFEKARDAVSQAYQTIRTKHLCAVNAPELDDEDGVVEAYSHLLSEVAELHDNLNSLCWLLGECEAEKEDALPGSYDNADDLFAAMGV